MTIWNKLFKRKIHEPAIELLKEDSWSTFSTDEAPTASRSITLQNAILKSFQKDLPTSIVNGAMDSGIGNKLSFTFGNIVPDAQISWYSSQGFIGYQTSAILAQHWLISKACLMPAEDAVRNGYKVTVNDGTEVDEKILDEIRELDVKFNINKNLIEFIQMGRVFGIRIALFQVDVPDLDDYYFKPFNPDGITPGSYLGISQIDPYWITPELDADAAGNPASKHFYEPTWWRINGRRIHRTHLVIFRTEEVPDILKPTYIYGGIPIPQKIYERVYAAERTANEAPMLALTKRTDVLKVDLSAAASKQKGFMARMERWVFNRDNYGVKVIGHDDDMLQFDTSLTDLDAAIMTQFQLVAAACNVPAVKLLGTSPKGFNTTGEFEESNYHEELESIQKHDGTPLLDRHHLLLIRSEIVPKYGIVPFSTEISWNALDAMTAQEVATVNKTKADTGQVLMNSGAISGEEERQRVINDPESGYSGLNDEMSETEELSDDINA